MIIAAPAGRDVLAVPVAEDKFAGWPGLDFANAGQRQVECVGQGCDAAVEAACRGEQQFVIVAAGQQAVALQSCRGQSGDVQAGGNCGLFQDVPEIGQQPVGNIDGSAGDSAQGQAQRHSRLRPMQCRQAGREQGFGQSGASLQVRQTQRRPPRPAGYPDRIARPGAVAAQGLPGGGFAEDGDAKGARSAGGVAADQIDAEAGRTVEEAAGESFQPVGRRFRQGECKRCPARLCAHRRHVRDIHREGLPAQRFRIGVCQEMRALNQQVGRYHQFLPGRRHDQCAVVADAKHRVARRALEEMIDQFKFGRHENLFATEDTEITEEKQGGFLCALCVLCGYLVLASPGRSTPASLSSTPLTNLWPSVPPKVFASSMASLMITR